MSLRKYTTITQTIYEAVLWIVGETAATTGRMSKAKYLTRGFSLNYGVVFAVRMGVQCARVREECGIASAGVRLPEFRENHSFYVDTNQAEYLVSTWGIIQARGFELDNINVRWRS